MHLITRIANDPMPVTVNFSCPLPRHLGKKNRIVNCPCGEDTVNVLLKIQSFPISEIECMLTLRQITESPRSRGEW